jgi:hypothetical protein
VFKVPVMSSDDGNFNRLELSAAIEKLQKQITHPNEYTVNSMSDYVKIKKETTGLEITVVPLPIGDATTE